MIGTVAAHEENTVYICLGFQHTAMDIVIPVIRRVNTGSNRIQYNIRSLVFESSCALGIPSIMTDEYSDGTVRRAENGKLAAQVVWILTEYILGFVGFSIYTVNTAVGVE